MESKNTKNVVLEYKLIFIKIILNISYLINTDRYISNIKVF